VGEGQGGGRSSRGPRPSECAGICLPPPQPSPTRAPTRAGGRQKGAKGGRPADSSPRLPRATGSSAAERRQGNRPITPHVKTFPTVGVGYTDSPRVVPVSWRKEVPRSSPKAIGAVGQDRGRRAQMGRAFGVLGDIDNSTRPATLEDPRGRVIVNAGDTGARSMSQARFDCHW
jgi:hypothetical protein